jgi:superfamily I DNA and/or RNA helicase
MWLYPNNISYNSDSFHRSQYEDTGSQVFRKYILNLKIKDISRKNQQLCVLPKTLEWDDTRRYYQNFLPLILEETRAILAQGLDAESKNKIQSFEVTIVNLNCIARNPNNPANLELEGSLPKNTDVGRACIVLKLTYFGIGNRSTSILSLADIKENNLISAKIILTSSNNSYTSFISNFKKRNPTAFTKGSKWTACILGSVLSQMRMYEACYDPPEPSFIQEVITGQLQCPTSKVVHQFPEFNSLQQQAIQAFSELPSEHQHTIIKFFSLDFPKQILILNFFSLQIPIMQIVEKFLSLNTSEQEFIKFYYLLNAFEQKAVNVFLTLDLARQQVINSFSAFSPSEQEAINTFGVSPVSNREAIQYFSSLDALELETAKKFSLLADFEWETVSTFYMLMTSEQEVVEEFYNLNNSLQKLIQYSSSLFPSIWKFFTGKSWYKNEINRLRGLLNDIETRFNTSQQYVIKHFYQLSPLKQKMIHVYFSPHCPNKETIQLFLRLNTPQRQAVKDFYGLNTANQTAIKSFYKLNPLDQDNIKSFYEMNASEQKVIEYFYALNELQQKNVQSFYCLSYSKQSVVKDFFVLNHSELKTLRTFSALSPTMQTNIKNFSLFDASSRQAISYFFPLSPSKKVIYKEFYDLNHSQRVAVRNFYGLTGGIQLLQGPPGTGKTTTIVTLLNFLCIQNKRILVCAPSNKAVQVIAERFLEKHPDKRSLLIGVEEKLKPSLRPIFIHTWAKDMCLAIDQCINIAKSVQHNKSTSYHQLFQKIQWIIDTIQHATELFNDYLDTLKGIFQLTNFRTASLGELVSELSNLKIKIYDANKRGSNQSASQLELELLNYAQVVFSTLNTSGRRIFGETTRPDILIIDEASQAVEAETLIPFALQPNKCLLVGDTKQLPATVISQEAVQFNYHWSMMWRLIEECGQKCDMLTTQYRMHPSIRQWPSEQYYNNQLEDAPTIANRPDSVSQYGSYAFIDLASEERCSNHSFYNPEECTQVITTLRELAAKNVDIKNQVGIITFYAAQVDYMQRKFNKLNYLAGVNVHTVDSYQGNESDYIIISFVRSNLKGGIGFLHDFRRLNVAITRARLALLMVGNAATLERYGQQDVAKLVKDARNRGYLFNEIEQIQVAQIKRQPYLQQVDQQSILPAKVSAHKKPKKYRYRKAKRPDFFGQQHQADPTCETTANLPQFKNT